MEFKNNRLIKKIESWDELLIPYTPTKYPPIKEKRPSFCGYCNTGLELNDIMNNLCKFCYSKV